MIQNPRVRASFNRFLGKGAVPADAAEPRETLAFHRSLPPYRPSPLRELPGLAAELGVGRLFVKDEAERFGLKAFKALGASYAIYRFIRKAWEQKVREPFDMGSFLNTDVSGKLGRMTFCTATDGNHGRAVAWTARQLKQRAVIYVPSNTVKARTDAIASEGAEVVVVDGNYDQTVERSAKDAEQHGWQVISDTAWPGYTEIPEWIMQGYRTLFVEADEQLASGSGPKLTHVLAQAGVGGLACAATRHYFATRRSGDRPRLISVEPLDADCLLESILSSDGERHIAKGKQNSIMAGLNCGTPSLVAWPVIRASYDFFIATDDDYARDAMRRLYAPRQGDPKIISGESGAAGLAGLLALCTEDALAPARRELHLDGKAVVLLINTEGDTDPESFRQIVSSTGR